MDEITIAIFKQAQKILKGHGIGTQVRSNEGALRFHRFSFGGCFRLEIGNKTVLEYSNNATFSYSVRHARFKRTFPDIVNPAFKPDDVVAVIVKAALYLQGLNKFFDKD